MIQLQSTLLGKSFIARCALAAVLCAGTAAPYAVGIGLQADAQSEGAIEVVGDDQVQAEMSDVGQLTADAAQSGDGKHHHHGDGSSGQQGNQQDGQQGNDQQDGQSDQSDGQGDQQSQQEPITYLDVDGNEQTVTEYRPFSEAVASDRLESGCYVLGVLGSSEAFALQSDMKVTGDVTLIMDAPVLEANGYSIVVEEGATLRIYAQRSYVGSAFIKGGDGICSLIQNRGTLLMAGVDIMVSRVAVESAATSSFTLGSGKIQGFGERDVILHDGADARVYGGKVGSMLVEEGAKLHLQGAPVIDTVRIEGGKTGNPPIVCDANLDLGASVGIDCDGSRTLTSGYAWHNEGAAPVYPDAFFHAIGNERHIELADDTHEVAFCDDRPLYLDEKGTEQLLMGNYTDISDESFKDKNGYSLGDGWYVVRNSRDFSNRLNIAGDVKLILCDGATANFKKGIHGRSGQLTIYAQSTGKQMGKLIAKGEDLYAGIGGDNDDSHEATNKTDIYIYGGRIEADGGAFAAGIGGGNTGGCGKIFICGGDVDANGRSSRMYFAEGAGAGIGSGHGAHEGGSVTISGGKVYAHCYNNWNEGIEPEYDQYAAAIGSGDESEAVDVTINGGEVTARGGFEAAAIGGGDNSPGHVTITGGVIDAKACAWEGLVSPGCGAAIGGGDKSGCDVKITGGTIVAKSDDWGAGIGTGDEGGVGKVEISGGSITATGGKYAAGIGGGNEASCNVTISGGTIESTAGEYGAGIGTGDQSKPGKITISGGDVTATGGPKGAGIGGGNECSGGTIKISGGNVKAYAPHSEDVFMPKTYGGAGIGGGDEGDSGTIEITGGVVEAEAKGSSPLAIGKGGAGVNKKIVLGDRIMVVGNKGDQKTGKARYDAIESWHWVKTMPID